MSECETDENPSALPPHTREVLYASGAWALPGTDARPCEGAEFHSPRPLFTLDTMLVRRDWWPEHTEEGHPPAAVWVWAPKAYLCGTCRDNLDILLQMLHAHDGDLDWAVRREFGNKIRALALKGWEWFSANVDRDEATDA